MLNHSNNNQSLTINCQQPITNNQSLTINDLRSIDDRRDEQMIEKIINKFVQVEVPDGGFAACRKEIQFSIPLQQKSRGRSLPGHGTRGDPRIEETTEEELSKPGTNESETSVSSEGVGLGGGI